MDVGPDGSPVFDIGEFYHVGLRVADLEATQRELSTSLGITWTTPLNVPMSVWEPEKGNSDLQLQVSFSRQGPVHYELMQGSPGSYYDSSVGGLEIHHFGLWVDDVTASIEELTERGWAVELASKAPAQGYGGFAFVRSPTGVIVEPQSYLDGAKERFARWTTHDRPPGS